MSKQLTNNEYLELATKDIEGYDLLEYISNKYPQLHPDSAIEFLANLYKDKKYQKLIANLIVIKLQRIRSQTLKQINELMSEGADVDFLKSLDKLLAIVLRFTKLDEEEEQNKNHITIRYTDGTEEKFKKAREAIQKQI